MDYEKPEARFCCNRISVKKFCAWVSISDVVAHLFLSVYLTELAMEENIFVPFVIVALLLALLSALYYVGIHKDNDNIMIPMVVAKVLLVLMIGLMVIFSWIALLLSCFSLVRFEVIGGLSPPVFLLILSMVATVTFIVLLRIVFLLHDAYRSVKKDNDRKRMNDVFIPYGRVSICQRPTFV